MDFQRLYQRYRLLIDERLRELTRRKAPLAVYEPIAYALRGGGKRVRPVLTLLACEAVGGTTRQALNAAVAMEMLHNFTLIHDDIMDRATVRRGNQTVHVKWNTNVAILAGDQMVALAYETLIEGIPRAQTRLAMVQAFTSALREVCEGQGFDEELQRRNGVTIRDYHRMIDKKTAAMIAGAARLGGIVGRGNSREIDALHAYGRYLGRAFQIQDDLLDIIAEGGSFGKAIGGDLQEGKKTYLLVKALELSSGSDRQMLLDVTRRARALQKLRRADVDAIREIFERYGIIEEAKRAVRRTTARAKRMLQVLRPGRATAMLSWFADHLVGRTS